MKPIDSNQQRTAQIVGGNATVALNIYQPTHPLYLNLGKENVTIPVPNGDFRLFSHLVLTGDGKRQRESRSVIMNVVRAAYLKGLEDGHATK